MSSDGGSGLILPSVGLRKIRGDLSSSLLGANVDCQPLLILWDKFLLPEIPNISNNLDLVTSQLNELGVLFLRRARPAEKGPPKPRITIHPGEGLDASYPLFHPQSDNDEVGLRVAELTFEEMEEYEPGVWSLARSPHSSSTVLAENSGRAILVRLHGALPVPVGEIAYQEILEFKERRRPEIEALREHIGETYEKILSSDDRSHALQRSIGRLERAVIDQADVMHEFGFRVRFAGLEGRIKWEVGLERSALGALATAAAGFSDATALLLGGALSNVIPKIEVSSGASLSTNRGRVPFEYIVHAQDELGPFARLGHDGDEGEIEKFA